MQSNRFVNLAVLRAIAAAAASIVAFSTLPAMAQSTSNASPPAPLEPSQPVIVTNQPVSVARDKHAVVRAPVKPPDFLSKPQPVLTRLR